MALSEIKNLETLPGANLFPLGRNATDGTFKELAEAGSSWGYLLDTQRFAMKDQNFEAFVYLEGLGDNFIDEEIIQGFNMGTAFAYAVFQQRAGALRIPTLTGEFVEKYDDDKDEHLRLAYNNSESFMVEGADKEHWTRLNLFRIVERGCYDSMEANLRKNDKDKMVLFENALFIGFVYTYFLFRKGLEHPGNYI